MSDLSFNSNFTVPLTSSITLLLQLQLSYIFEYWFCVVCGPKTRKSQDMHIESENVDKVSHNCARRAPQCAQRAPQCARRVLQIYTELRSHRCARRVPKCAPRISKCAHAKGLKMYIETFKVSQRVPHMCIESPTHVYREPHKCV